jgi:hypothetical protein
MNTLYRAALGSIFALSVVLFAMHASAQSPPTATEAFNLRIKCKKMSDEKAEDVGWHPMSVEVGASVGMSPAAVAAMNEHTRPEVLASWHTSKYDPINNRCYGRIYIHHRKDNGPNWRYNNEEDVVYDLQTDDLLANAFIKNGKKTGNIWDPDYRKPPLSSCGPAECPADWQAAEDYMDEIMAEPRK